MVMTILYTNIFGKSSILEIFLVKFTIMKIICFAENLKILRKNKKLTQSQLAEIMGVDQRTVSAWENSICEPSFTTLSKLCEFFDETFDSILT